MNGKLVITAYFHSATQKSPDLKPKGPLAQKKSIECYCAIQIRLLL